ncbi:HpyAIV family type II restriction enzyme [Mycoplasma simbae]|uniref:HpyAIV family type II restriction enzyme n=1 Tax=Mycoplasma simbae TaxID=36744 RepID=UPI000495A97C|nr:hypothetical protein [Mycoplasma simbae]
MDYAGFKLRLKQALLSGNGPKLLQKLFDAPYRYNSNLHPFNIVTKMEQSFLRTQENKYYKFILECAEYTFSQSFDSENTEFLKNSFNLKYIDKTALEGEAEDLTPEQLVSASKSCKFRVNLAWINHESKQVYIIQAKKQDTDSPKQIMDLIDKIDERLQALAQNYVDFKINYFVWFVNDFYTNNYDLLNEGSIKLSNETTDFKAFYGSSLFGNFNLRSNWDEIAKHIVEFKAEDWSELLKMPNLNTDPETLEYMISLKESSWDKIISDDANASKIRELIFDLSDPNNNFDQAKAKRNIIMVEQE